MSLPCLGYRHIDCASDYGNEKSVGIGIKQAIEEGVVTRNQIWVTSKLYVHPTSSFGSSLIFE